MNLSIEKIGELKWNDDGLIPAIVQDAASKEVLMLAYMNEEALKRTIESGETWFWSRSRKAYWHKGETSGHTQKVCDIRFDCDQDTLLILVEPQGPACHKGSYSCFSNDEQVDANQDRFSILAKLEEVIAKREAERPEGAYTTYLFDEGVDKILKKVGEESAEVIIAAKNRDPDELRMEASDLIYHLLVLLREQKLPIDDVMKELTTRHAR